MKKYVCIIIALWCCILSGCGSRSTEETTPAPTHVTAAFEWETFLKNDVFDTATPLGNAISQAVTIRVDEVSATELTVTVQSPNICQTMEEWISAVSEGDFTEDALHQKILDALTSSEKQTLIFTIPYSMEQDLPEIRYPADYLDAASCGLLTFYNKLCEQVLTEMGGADNE